MWESGDAQSREFDAALEMIAEGANDPEADRIIQVPRTPGENPASHDNYQQNGSEDDQPHPRSASSLRH
jgi:hypothetical protein